VDEVDAEHHHHGTDHGSERQVETPDRGECDSGEDTVSDGITEEGEPAQHDPRSDQRGGGRSDQTTDERPAGDVGRERVSEEVPHWT
jgi:hypothetical protein